MEKGWSATSLVVLALFGIFAATNVEAQGSPWQNPGTQMNKGVPPRQTPKVIPRPDPPKVIPRPDPPKVIPRPDPPKVIPRPDPPKVIPRPDPPKVIPRPDPPKILPRPDPQQATPPKYPQYPQQAFHDQSSQEPKIPNQQYPKLPDPPLKPPPQACEVTPGTRVPCGVPEISAAVCESINCCFDGRQCYFPNAVTVQCTKDAQFIVVVDKYATLPPIDLEKISLLEGGRDCTQVDSNSDFAIYQFPVTSCGTVVMEGPGVIIYENRLTSSYEVDRGDHGVITRDTSFDLLFQCRYFGTSVETLVAEVFPLDVGPLPDAGWGPIRVQMRLANGQCGTKGCNELDAAFTSFYTEADYPVGKVLRDPVYVEVQLLGKTDPNLVLTLGRCWATTSNQPHTLPQWDLLIDGCPYRDDRYTSALIPIGPNSGLDLPNHFKRFLFKMFTFVGTSSAKGVISCLHLQFFPSSCTKITNNFFVLLQSRYKREFECQIDEITLVLDAETVICSIISTFFSCNKVTTE
uniref:Zona pellucida sperm-binding protein 4 n=1 Tax=Echeneis naucrates TaxID=173247 RepID=A0A665XBZ8_ECHNA